MLVENCEGCGAHLDAKRSSSSSLVVALATRWTFRVVLVEAVVYHDGVRWLGWSELVKWAEYLVASLRQSSRGGLRGLVPPC